MGRKPAPRQETNTERASRVRDNKRRHRARQKEYVLELERSVTKTREQGIQVTKEVQLAAQKVTRENARLRDLLRRTGYTEDAIDAWVREDRFLHDAERPQLVLKSTSENSVQKVASACVSRSGREPEAQNVSEAGKLAQTESSESGECLTKTSTLVESRISTSEASSTKVCGGTCTQSSSSSRHADSAIAPCKLLTLLAKNPAADITQVPLPEPDNQSCGTVEPDGYSSDGVECSTAYKMLMHYATSDEKMNRIAASLESGCTPSAAGGCKVKKSVVWKALDEECT